VDRSLRLGEEIYYGGYPAEWMKGRFGFLNECCKPENRISLFPWHVGIITLYLPPRQDSSKIQFHRESLFIVNVVAFSIERLRPEMVPQTSHRPQHRHHKGGTMIIGTSAYQHFKPLELCQRFGL